MVTRFLWKSGLPCLLLLVLFVSGCAERRPPGFPTLYPVTLHVTQEGEPLADASVSLRWIDNSMTWSIGGTTDEKGNVRLATHGKFEGAPLGKFKVVVFKTVSIGEKEYEEASNRGDLKAAEKIDVQVFSHVENRYNSPDTTPIEIEITKKDRLIEVDAGKAVKIKQVFMK